MALATEFMRDLIRLQNKVDKPFTAEVIGRIMNEWRDYDSSETYYRHMTDEEHLKRLAVYRQATSDHDAARKLGLGYKVFYRWRKYHGLPPKGTPGVKRKEVAVCGG